MSTVIISKVLAIVLIIMGFFMNAQIIISGKVSFRNKGFKDVSVTIKDSYDGSTTDQNGIFTFQTSEKGSQTLVFSHPKFVEFEKSIVIENRPVNVDADLKEQISEMRSTFEHKLDSMATEFRKK